MTRDEQYMQRCLDLAKEGLGSTAPNPMVGSVIVHDGQIIGEGYHQVYGGPHAEVNAIRSVKDQSLLAFSTLYVNLEPCSHHGKTPPCADLIIEKKIPRVVIGAIDCNEKVCGNGVELMQNAGIKTTINILEKECRELNRRFYTFHEKKRPYVILKWAQTKDDFIDIIRKPGMPVQPTWISDEASLTLVHKWRTEEQAIMVGTNTALNDNPKLTARLWKGRNPVRIVLDRTLRLPAGLALFDGSQQTIVFTEKKTADRSNVEFITVPFDESLIRSVMHTLAEKKIQSVIIEGGSMLLNSLIGQNAWDEIRVFRSHKTFGEGLKAPVLNAEPVSREQLTDSVLEIYRKPV